jgi:hypothetical protein
MQEHLSRIGNERGRSSMPPLDAFELEWFFSRGQIAFERSNFGSMLARQDMYSIARCYRPEMRPVYDKQGHVIGHERGITARPTAELRAPAGYTPDSDTLTRYAHVSALLKRMPHAQHKALEALYGDLGQRWAGNERFGRYGALFHLTVKGRKLIEAARTAKGALELTDEQRIEVLCAVQRVQPTADRAQALAVCLAQSQALAAQANAGWLVQKSALPSRKRAARA